MVNLLFRLLQLLDVLYEATLKVKEKEYICESGGKVKKFTKFCR